MGWLKWWGAVVSGAPSPDDHITAVIYPDWAAKGENRQAKWAADCTNEQCTGVPIYRQYLTGTKGKDAASSTREWVTWVGNDCDKLMNKIRDRSRPWVNPSDKIQPTVDPDFIATTRNATFHSPAPGLMQGGRGVPAPECAAAAAAQEWGWWRCRNQDPPQWGNESLSVGFGISVWGVSSDSPLEER